MLYSDLILQEDEYTYSVNIQFDIENDKKLGRFIPNETTIELLKDYFIDISREKSLNHSRILYGSYGTGKSHFLTVLSLLLGKMHVNGIAYDTFFRRVRAYDTLLANDIDSFTQNRQRKPYLIVPITFDFEDFERSIYFSLRRALEKHSIEVKFKTFFTYALTLLEQWNGAGESAQRLQTTCKKNRISLEALQNKLLSFDKKAEKLFRAIFSDMTYGVDFIYEAANLIDNLNEANVAIKEAYAGIIFIFDEFGRYLDDNIKTIRVKAVQDLAEYCDHGDFDTHLILVSHKEISLYTKNYGKSIANEWKKVEGRFKENSINDKQDQCLSLISSILERRPDYWGAFKNKYNNKLDAMYASAMDFKGFLVTAIGNENPFEGGFPLHPITLFALDKLSKRVAQNERTFFTYLASKEENSLWSFLSRTEDTMFHFVGIDELYDYFEPSIKAIQSDTSYEWYRKFSAALSKGKFGVREKSPMVKILKLLVIVGIIDDGSTLSPDKKTILNVIDEPQDEIKAALDTLIQQKIIKYVGSVDRYEFFDGSIYDVDQLIADEMANISDELVCEKLNNTFIDFVLYPNEYNQVYHINRVFIPVYTTAEELAKKSFLRQLPDFYDGALAMVLCDVNVDTKKLVDSCREIPRTIAVVTTDYEKISFEVKKYIGILCLESKIDVLKGKDPAIENEIKFYKNEQSSLVRKMLSEWRFLHDDRHFVIDGNEVLSQCSFSDLTQRASAIMFREFPDTLVVNNELINKNVLSGAMTSAKKNAIRAMLKGAPSQNCFGLAYLSPEYICVRSVLAKNGLILDEQLPEEEINTLPDGRPSATAVNAIIEKYVALFKNKPTLISLFYEELRNPPLGLREGYLSLLLTYILLPYKKSVIINSHDVEQELSPELFDEMIRRPQDYTITITNWTPAQLSLLDSLELIFSENISSNTLLRNRLKGIYEGMFSQYKAIAKFSRTTDIYVSETAKKYRKLMEQTHTNYSKFFFEKLRGISGSYDTTADTIVGVLSEFNNAPQKLLSDLKQDILSIFGKDISRRMNVAALVETLYRNEWQEKSKKSFDYYTNAWLNFASKIRSSFVEEDVVAAAAKLLTGFEVQYWSDNHRKEYTGKLKDIFRKLDSFAPEDTLNEHQVKVALTYSQGDSSEKYFDVSELSMMSKTMKNKLITSINEFGQSVSYEEKVQVLLEILDDLLKNN